MKGLKIAKEQRVADASETMRNLNRHFKQLRQQKEPATMKTTSEAQRKQRFAACQMGHHYSCEPALSEAIHCECECHGLRQPMITTSAEANHEQHEAIFDICYQAIRNSGLYRLLDNAAWDALAERMVPTVRAKVEELVNAEFTRIEGTKNGDDNGSRLQN